MKKSAKGIILFILFLNLFFVSLVSAGELRVTEEHPFLVNGSWISASELHVGDILQTIDGKKVRITNLEDFVSSENFSVYNLEAGVYHDFVVNGGDGNGVVVHNSDKKNLLPSKRIPYSEELSADLFVTPSVKPSVRIDQNWVDFYRERLAYDPEALAIFDYYVSKFKFISESTFDADLELSTARFLEYTRRNPLRDANGYVLIMGRKPDSSPMFVFSKIKDLVVGKGKIEEGIYLWSGKPELPIKDPTTHLRYRVFAGMEYDVFLKNGRTRFVTFDDASYSAQELTDNFVQTFAASYNRVKAQGYVFKETPELHLVVPYLTSTARASLEAQIRSQPFKIHIHTSDYQPPIASEILTPQQIVKVNQAASDILMMPWDSSFVLEHKVADHKSLGEFTKFYVPNFEGYRPRTEFDPGVSTIYKLKDMPLTRLEDNIWDFAQNPDGAPMAFVFNFLLFFLV